MRKGSGCVHEWKLRTQSGYARRHVNIRDQGVCAICGLDTEGLKLWCRTKLVDPRTKDEVDTILWLLGFDHTCLGSALWHADHIIPVAEGGADLGLANLRTLCLTCHHAETAALRRRLVFRRKAAMWFARGQPSAG